MDVREVDIMGESRYCAISPLESPRWYSKPSRPFSKDFC